MAGSVLVGTFAGGTPRPMGVVIGLARLGSAASVWLLRHAPATANSAEAVAERQA